MSYVSWWQGSPCSRLPARLALSKPRSKEEVTRAQRLETCVGGISGIKSSTALPERNASCVLK